ncbi:MAG: hypothetical protein AVDCRST_MAG03-2261, partial [uncultured Rubrobacteraceae bacterium]
ERRGFPPLPFGHLRCDLGPGPNAAPDRRRTPGVPGLRDSRRLRGPEPHREHGLRARRRNAPLGRAATAATRAPAGLRGRFREGGGGRGPGPRGPLAVRDLARGLVADAACDALFRGRRAALVDAWGGRRGPGAVPRQRRAQRRAYGAAVPGWRGDARRDGARIPGLPRGRRLLSVVRRAGRDRGGSCPQRRLRGVGRLLRPVVRRARRPYNPGCDRRGRRHLHGRQRRGAV